MMPWLPMYERFKEMTTAQDGQREGVIHDGPYGLCAHSQ